MPELFYTIKNLQQDVMRNIVSIPSSQDIFSDLLANKSDAVKIATKLIQRILPDNDYHYTAAIGYPFETDHFMKTRYSDGSFPVWYGSMDKQTTIYETVHHMIQAETQISSIGSFGIVKRNRVIYNVFCQGILIDLSKKQQQFIDLISDDYQFTQQIGQQLKQEGFPGLLSPSARHKNGINVNIFKQQLLCNPRIVSNVSYQFYPALKKIDVYENENLIETIFK